MTAHLPTTTYGCSPASLGDGLYHLVIGGLGCVHGGAAVKPQGFSFWFHRRLVVIGYAP